MLFKGVNSDNAFLPESLIVAPAMVTAVRQILFRSVEWSACTQQCVLTDSCGGRPSKLTSLFYCSRDFNQSLYRNRLFPKVGPETH